MSRDCPHMDSAYEVDQGVAQDDAVQQSPVDPVIRQEDEHRRVDTDPEQRRKGRARVCRGQEASEPPADGGTKGRLLDALLGERAQQVGEQQQVTDEQRPHQWLLQCCDAEPMTGHDGTGQQDAACLGAERASASRGPGAASSSAMVAPVRSQDRTHSPAGDRPLLPFLLGRSQFGLEAIGFLT